MRRASAQTIRRYQTVTTVVSTTPGSGVFVLPSNAVRGSLYMEAISPSGPGAGSTFLANNGGGGSSCSYCGAALTSVEPDIPLTIVGVNSYYDPSGSVQADMTGVQPGEFVIMWIMSNSATSYPSTQTPSSGNVWSRSGSGSHRGGLYTKIAGNNESLNPTLTGVAGPCIVTIIRITGSDVAGGLDIASGFLTIASTTSAVVPSVTPTTEATMALSLLSLTSLKTMTSTPAGTTAVDDTASTYEAFVRKETLATTAPTGTRSWAWTGSATGAAVTVLIRPFQQSRVPWVNGTKGLGVSGAVGTASGDTTIGAGPLMRAKAGVSGLFSSAASAGGTAPTTGNLGDVVLYGNNGGTASGTGGIGAAAPSFPANPISGLSNFSPGAATGAPGGSAAGFNGNPDGGGASGGGAGTTKGGDAAAGKIVATYKVVL